MVKLVFPYFLLPFFIISCGSVSIIEKEGSKLPNIKEKREVSVDPGPSILNPENGFIDKSVEYGLEGIKATHFYVVDLNRDGFDDIAYLPKNYSIPEFYLFDPLIAKFVRISYNPFSEIVRASYLIFADFDGDHQLDLIMGGLNQKSALRKEGLRIYKGSFDKLLSFKEVKGRFSAKETSYTSSVGLFDYNLDGHLDLYHGNWYKYVKNKPMPITDRLLQGDGFKFSEVSFRLQDELLYNSTKGYYKATPTYGVSVCDVDQNGFPDILTSASSAYKNKMWLNLTHSSGSRVFKDYGDQSGFSQDDFGKILPFRGGNSLFSLCTDYNNDGVIDIVIGELTHGYDDENRDRSSVLTGKTNSFPPKFLRSEFYMDDGSEIWDQADYRGAFLDYNADGLVDFFTVNSGFPPKSRLIFFTQESDHGYIDSGKKLGVNILNPSGSVSLDINRDGLPDLLTGQSNVRKSDLPRRVYLFENSVDTDNNRVTLYLHGEKNNSDGIGAKIFLESGSVSQTRFANSSSGALPSQNSTGIIIGLGKEKEIKKLVVTWPYLDKKTLGAKKVSYNFTNREITGHEEFTLCDDGRFYKGRLYKKCY